MTQKQLIDKIYDMLYLLPTGTLDGTVIKAAEKLASNSLVKGQIIDPAENDFIIPKAVLHTIFKELAFQYEPMTKEGKEAVKTMFPIVKI